MKGFIGFSDYRIHCIIGILPEERLKKQDVLVDIKVKSDFSECVASGNITDTVNYVEMADICARLAWDKEYFLLEVFANDILNELIKRYKCEWAWVKIKKPGCIPGADYAFVELEKENRA